MKPLLRLCSVCCAALGLSSTLACSDDDSSGKLVPLSPTTGGVETTGGNASTTPGSETLGGTSITAGSDAGGTDDALAIAGSSGSATLQEPGWPQIPDDPRTEQVPGGTVQLGWAQLDIGNEANYDGGEGPGSCPDPDAMLTPGTVDYADGVWTLTGSGEGFIHGWDQGNLVYFKTKFAGDFTFTMKVDEFEMLSGKNLDGAAEALLNVRQDLGYKQPTHSIIAGATPSKFIFMARYSWAAENGKWWHWPAWPATWPNHRDIKSWTRLVSRSGAISAETSLDGVAWETIEHNDTNAQHPDWYPFRVAALEGERYVGLVCSARNDRNYAPLVKLPGKTVSCRDPGSDHLRGNARCVFSHVTLTQP